MAEVELGVDLCRRDVGVAEQLLHRAQVAARLQHVRRERVAQHVRMDVRRHAGGDRERLQSRADLARGESRAAAADEERRLVGVRDVAAAREPRRERGERRSADRNGAALAALAEDVRGRVVAVDPARRRRARDDVEADELADAQAAAVEQLGDARVAHRERVVVVAAVRDECDRVVDRERLGQRLRRARRANATGRIGVDRAGARQPAIEAPPRRQHERDRARREAARMQLRGEAPHVVGPDVAQRQRDLDCEPLEPVERVVVERERPRGDAALDPQVFEMAGDVGVARARRGVAPAHGCATLMAPPTAASARRSRPRRCARGSRCPCRR
jgi:hypothetical protein